MTTSVHDLELPEVDIFGLERAEAIQIFEDARSKHWLAKNQFGYTVTSHADVVAILRDRRFHSAISFMPSMQDAAGNSIGPADQQSILSMEGEPHARLRRLAAPAFTPKSADKLRPFMRDVVNGLVDEFADSGQCELIDDVCEPYPIPIICELLGAPKEDWKLFSSWATDIFRIFNNDIENDADKIRVASDELDAYVKSMIDDRRSKPADDLLSHMIAAEEDGDRMTTDELVMMSKAVLMAGTDTTRNQLACAVALLTDHTDQWAMLAEQPELAPRAVEECMRYLGAVRGTARIASEDITYRDVVFPTGTLVATSLVAANFDGDVFDDPYRFDITREPSGSSQMTFGSGIHFCMGAALARAELQEALPLLARRLPDLGLSAPIEWKPATVGIWGPSRLPLRFSVS